MLILVSLIIIIDYFYKLKKLNTRIACQSLTVWTKLLAIIKWKPLIYLNYSFGGEVMRGEKEKKINIFPLYQEVCIVRFCTTWCVVTS